ncbi:hypothetical protein CONLIGDRAFT_720013 [Coniochaeta ligniaria NRRL 30616]|uniref:Uncharacterized protein n=1 Tax=Coniochaeta ligniaria NRRL 30616 TaxID=1408157 RepID=A0A1J7J405_9PEZI|nr:hypothetical protein CONLIGDRAFT_720013 [Coniochaeta ligniaria NRRL 30616]
MAERSARTVALLLSCGQTSGLGEVQSCITGASTPSLTPTPLSYPAQSSCWLDTIYTPTYNQRLICLSDAKDAGSFIRPSSI